MFWLKITHIKGILMNIAVCILVVLIFQMFLFNILEAYIGHFLNKEKRIDFNIIESGEYLNNLNYNYFVSIQNENLIIAGTDTGKEIKRISYQGKKPVYYEFVKETDVLLFSFSDQFFNNIIIGSYNIYMDSIYEFAHTSTLPKGYAVYSSFSSSETNVFYFRLRSINDNDSESKKDVLYRYDLFENFEFVTYLDKDANIVVGKTKDFVFFDSNEGILFYDAGNKTIKPYSGDHTGKLPYSCVSDEFLHSIIK